MKQINVHKGSKKRRTRTIIAALFAVILIISMTVALILPAATANAAESSSSSSKKAKKTTETSSSKEIVPGAVTIQGDDLADEEGWVSFFLICNEGMGNKGGNSGNTMMVASLNENSGQIRLMTFEWDTFIKYEGYDLPQKIDMAYRNRGPEETMNVFNYNFDTGVERYLSLNFLNLASLIDDFGGVTVNVTRAERNALNGMVSAKKENIQAMVGANLIGQEVLEMLADEYYLNEFGPNTHLNGLQAAGYGWLQYDSVYNCCLRDGEVISSLFKSASESMLEKVSFYTDETGKPKKTDNRRQINLDQMTKSDVNFLMKEVSPIFDMSYNNMTNEDIISVTTALARAAYLGSRQGYSVMDHIQTAVFPLEAKNPLDLVAGAKGHLVDYEENSKAMKDFLFSDQIAEEE